MKQSHKHVQCIIAWAHGEEVEFFNENMDQWEDVGESHYWNPDREHRLKQKMISCGDLEFPESMRVAPSLYTSYWTAEITKSGIFIDRWTWVNDLQDNRSLQLGICHLTSEAAEAHAKALVALTEVK